MDIAQNFQVEKEIAPGFKVRSVSTKPMMLDIANPIIDFTEVRLECLYENVALLTFATFKEKTPPSKQWIQLGLDGKENNKQLWKSQKIKQECACIDYTRRIEAGHLVAVTHIITAKKNILLSAQLMWFGFPFVNRFFVGFKPGMRERTEELMLAGLKFA